MLLRISPYASRKEAKKAATLWTNNYRGVITERKKEKCFEVKWINNPAAIIELSEEPWIESHKFKF